MRGVNIHADFAMIQCTKNKNLTSLSHPLCHPAMRRGSKIPLAYGSRLRPAGFAEASAICPLNYKLPGSSTLQLSKNRCRGITPTAPVKKFVVIFALNEC